MHRCKHTTFLSVYFHANWSYLWMMACRQAHKIQRTILQCAFLFRPMCVSTESANCFASNSFCMGLRVCIIFISMQWIYWHCLLVKPFHLNSHDRLESHCNKCLAFGRSYQARSNLSTSFFWKFCDIECNAIISCKDENHDGGRLNAVRNIIETHNNIKYKLLKS